MIYKYEEVTKNHAKAMFKKNLEILLEEKGLQDLDEKAIAKKINTFFGKSEVSRNSVEKWRNGNHLPRYKTFIKLADWLDCKPEDILTEALQEVLHGYLHN